MANPDITPFPGGVNDATETGQFHGFGGLVPYRYFTFNDDFIRYTAADWVVTETDAGSTEAVTTAAEGVLAITNVSAGATDAASLQWAGGSGAVSPQFVWDPTKDFLLYSRFKVSVAATTGLIIGVASTDTTPVASLPTDGIFVTKTSASTTLNAIVRKAGVSSTVALGAMADDTYVTAGFYFSSTTNIWSAYLNNALIGSITTDAIAPTVNLAPTIGVLNGAAVALVLSVDKLFVAKQR